MKILTFLSEAAAKAKCVEFANLARHETSPADLEVAPLYKHPTLPLWWIILDEFVAYGGSNKAQIQSRGNLLTVVDILVSNDDMFGTLKGLGYFKEVDPQNPKDSDNPRIPVDTRAEVSNNPIVP